MAARGTLKITFVGHVDHGKSTTIGRLLHETGALPPGKVAELETLSTKRGAPFEWSFVLDALQAERDQAVTIDTTRVWFTWNDRRYEIIDAPGHREFVRNMLSGSSEADAAVLVVDAKEGVSEQTRRHAQLIGMLGIAQLVVVVNKMDTIGFDRARFDAVAADATALLAQSGITPAHVVPISARDGVNLVEKSDKTPWYAGPSMLDALGDFSPASAPAEAPLRFRVQDVYRQDDTTRVAVGRINAGTVRVGQKVVLFPSEAPATIRSIDVWNAPAPETAHAGQSVGLTFVEPVYIDRGYTVSSTEDPPALDHAFTATTFWMSGTPPIEGEDFIAQFGPVSARVSLVSLHDPIDSASLEPMHGAVSQYALVQMELRSRALLPLDLHSAWPALSRFVLLRGDEVVGGGFVTATTERARHAHLHPASHLVTGEERERRNGHRGAVIWLTGLSGSGKSTLAMQLERRLFARGASVAVLDGDNVRTGLNADLGFSERDRSENIRRIAEVAALFAQTGTIVITAFISPMEQDRHLAHNCIGDRFHEVYVSADLATCEKRDVKGLYAAARAGDIQNFTGISAPYEPPADPSLIINTANETVDVSVDKILAYAINATKL